MLTAYVFRYDHGHGEYIELHRQNSAFVRIIPLKWVILRIRYLYLCHVSQMEKMCAIFLLFAPYKLKHI